MKKIVVKQKKQPEKKWRNMIHKQGGFTLVEILVSLALFSVIISMAVGGFIQALRTERQAVALFSVNDSISFLSEQISREVRTGYDFIGHGTSLEFTNSRGERVFYCFDESGEAVTRGVGSCSSASALTPSSLRVTNFSFDVLGDPAFPPRITYHLSITPHQTGLTGASFTIQSTVSARNF